MNEDRLRRFKDIGANITVITDLELDGKYYNIVNNHSQINAIIIDNRTLWYGSINPFSYSGKDETILRLVDEEYVNEILKDYVDL